MQLVGSAVNLRSFLDRPVVAGHTIKGSGMVSFKSNRFNTNTQPMDYTLERAVNNHLHSLGVRSSDYNFGPVQVLDTKVRVSINGRRYKIFAKFHNILTISFQTTKIL
jgi:hypothetical protein